MSEDGGQGLGDGDVAGLAALAPADLVEVHVGQAQPDELVQPQAGVAKDSQQRETEMSSLSRKLRGMDIARTAFVGGLRLTSHSGVTGTATATSSWGVVVVPDAVAAELSRRLRKHLPAGLRRWHWRGERRGSRRRFLSLMANFVEVDVTAFTCGQLAASQRKSEQARVRCTWDLLGQLQLPGVGTVVFESRQEHNDRKDRREVLGAQRAGVAPQGLVYRHGRPRGEPLLWLPDALVGAVGVAAALGEPEYRELLPDGWQSLRWLPVP